jgi:hypothetical protein
MEARQGDEMTSLATKTETAVARPLKVLVPLIRSDFEQAEKAGMQYYIAAGEKLIEAREGHYENDAVAFFDWAKKEFGKERTQIRAYMALTSVSSRKSFKNLEQFKRHQDPDRHNQTTGRRFRDWTAPVDAIAEKARDEQRRLIAEEEMTRRQEREAEAKLGLRLIDIGYKVLARELHPDKLGGSREAMTRLNRVRERLKANV